jgi:hypothetical protein
MQCVWILKDVAGYHQDPDLSRMGTFQAQYKRSVSPQALETSLAAYILFLIRESRTRFADFFNISTSSPVSTPEASRNFIPNACHA